MMIFVLVFLGVFALIALPLVGSSLVPSRSTQQAIATLDSALKTESQEKRQLTMNLKKNENISSIPWLNQKLLKLELTPYLRKMLAQAAVPWSTGRLMMMSAALFVLPAYAVMAYLSSLPIALGAGALLGMAPFGWVMFKRARRFGAFEK